MDRESIIRKLKDNKKLILAFGVISVVLIAILVPVLIYVTKQIEIDLLFQKAKDGIYREELFLEHGNYTVISEDPPTIGYELKKGYTFKIYAEKDDAYHFHYITSNSSFNYIMLEMKCSLFNEKTLFHGQSDEWTTSFWKAGGIYTISIYNVADEDGYITFFFVVYTNRYFPPDCPLC